MFEINLHGEMVNLWDFLMTCRKSKCGWSNEYGAYCTVYCNGEKVGYYHPILAEVLDFNHNPMNFGKIQSFYGEV